VPVDTANILAFWYGFPAAPRRAAGSAAGSAARAITL
jgi:hypothetical protein